MSSMIDRDAIAAAGFPVCDPRAAGEPIANYQSRLAAFIIRERTIATLSDDELAQGDIGLMRAICALPAKLEDVDLRLVGMLSDLRHWIATTIRARATGIVPMVIPELPKDTRPAGGQLSELQPAPKVDPHGPNGTAASVHDVHPDWAQPTIAAAAVTGPAAIPAQYTAISPAIGARQPTARATSAQPAAVEW